MPFQGLTGRAAYAGLYAASFWGLTLGWGVRVSGRRNVPAAGPVLFLANHQSFADPLLVALAVAPRRLTHLARANLFSSPKVDRVIRYFGGIPVDRGFARDGLQAVLAKLAAGQAVVVFPEGERTFTGRMGELKPGVTLLLRRADVPVVPVGIAGAFAAWPRMEKFPKTAPLFLPSTGRSIAVSIGRPIPAGTFKNTTREETLAELTAAIAAACTDAEKLRRR